MPPATASELAAHQPLLWRLCYRMTGSAADADDLVQETFVRAIAQPPRDQERDLRPWLVQVALNLSRDHLRRRKRRAYEGPWLPAPIETEGFSLEAHPEARYSELESVSSAFLLALEALSPRQRAVLLLCDVLGYSESLEAVSLTATSTEVLRGLGYWLFYIRDPVAFATTAAERYMTVPALVATGLALTIAAVAGLALVDFRARRFAVLLVVAGVVLAVGVHPIDDPSPLMSALAGDSRSTVALALRSSTRALPLSVLGLSLGIGALVTAVRDLPWRAVRIAPVLAAALVILGLPALWTGGFVDPTLERDQDVPAAWTEGAARLDENGAVESAVIRQSIDPTYDRIAIEASRSWRYKPATRDGVAVKFRKLVQVKIEP